MNRRLYRCRDNRLVAGVAAGVAEYFDVDPSLVRLFWFLSIFVGGIGILLYIAMAIIVPLEPLSADHAAAAASPEGHRHTSRGSGRITTVVGALLILFGAMALVNRFLPELDLAHFIVPAFAIGLGALLVATSIRREPTPL
ncbi:MAG TPA: PspC domain-containing protein [Candidatus Limnocylindrales bacterium]|nr:PspC domain-containing protein [Candidatus Limnocylindrales bacterium]